MARSPNNYYFIVKYRSKAQKTFDINFIDFLSSSESFKEKTISLDNYERKNDLKTFDIIYYKEKDTIYDGRNCQNLLTNKLDEITECMTDQRCLKLEKV